MKQVSSWFNVTQWRSVAALCLVAMLPLIGYQFGLGNQVEQLTLVGRLLDPSYLRGDFYVDSAIGFGPRFYYCLMLAQGSKLLPIWMVVLVMSLLAAAGLAFLTYWAARRLLGVGVLPGLLAALMVVANDGFSLGLAGYLRFDSFQPANLAILLALMGVTLLLSERYVTAGVMFGLSSMMHPLIGVEIGAIAYAAVVLVQGIEYWQAQRRQTNWGRLSGSIIVFLIIVGNAWFLPMLNVSAGAISDQEFVAILAKFRAPHHYFFGEFPRLHILNGLLFVASILFLYQWGTRTRPASMVTMQLICMVLLTVLICGAGVLLVDGLEWRTAVTAQVFRNLLLCKWIGYLLFARFVDRVQTVNAFESMLIFMPVLATGEAQPLVLFAVLGYFYMTQAPILVRWQQRRVLLSAFLLVLSVVLLVESASYLPMMRMMIGMTLFATVLSWRSEERDGKIMIVLIPVACIAGLVVLVAPDTRTSIRELLPRLTLDDQHGADYEIGRWAAQNSPLGSIWIVPPSLESFRLVAGRAVVVDFTSIPFSDGGLRAWYRRIQSLYGPTEGGGFDALASMEANYRRQNSLELSDRGRQYGATYAVLYSDSSAGAALFDNGSYKVVRLDDISESGGGRVE